MLTVRRTSVVIIGGDDFAILPIITTREPECLTVGSLRLAAGLEGGRDGPSEASAGMS